MTAPSGVEALFQPRSVAVVGASRKKSSIGRIIFKNLVDGEFQGPVFPVNRAAEVVQSVKAYARVTDIEDPVDLVVVAVPRDQVIDVAKDCAKKRVLGMVVITAGFREAGAEGRRREEELKRITNRANIRVIGPNCMGIINTAVDVRLNASFATVAPAAGSVAFATQSGALGEAILADAERLGVGISRFASIGNVVDVTPTDLIESFGRDPRTKVILLYLESFGDPRRFTRIARDLSPRKPIVVVKSGRSDAGARAAASHTGSLVGRDVAAESLLEQCGVIRAASVAELFHVAKAFANQPVPAGDRVAIVTNAGGPGILATDACVGHGLELATFRARTRKELEKALPFGAATGNPVDMIADADASRFERALRAVAADPGVDAVLAVFVSPVTTDAVAVARVIAAAGQRKKTLLACFMGKESDDEGVRILQRASVPVYRFPEEAVLALSALCRHRRLRDRRPGRVRSFPVDAARARAVVAKARRAGRQMLVGAEAEALLDAYGFPIARSVTTARVDDALAFAGEVGYPVVLKASSSKFVHKTDVGGVRTDIEDGDELFAAWNDFRTRLGRRDPKLKIQVQEQVTGSAEVILGASSDPQFGPLILFGLGGVHVEVLRDVAIRVHPITGEDAREMIRSIKGYPLLTGARGARAVDLGFLEEMLLRLSQLVGDVEEIAEIDLNPLILGAEGERAAVVDARIRVRSAGG